MPTHPQEPARILLVDDHSGVREALALVLAEEGIGSCLQAGCRERALDFVERETVDLAVVDLSLAEDGAFSLIAELRSRDIPVVVCSAHEDPEHVSRAMAAGARAYVAKRDMAQAVVRTVRDVLDGWILVSPRAADST